MGNKFSKEDIQCIYWLANCKNGKCDSLDCECGRFCCLDRDELIVLEDIAELNKDWEIAYDGESFFTSAEKICDDRWQNLSQEEPSLIKFDMEISDIEKRLDKISKVITDSDSKLMKIVPIVQGINSTYDIEEREPVVRICLQTEVGEMFLQSIFIKVLKKAFEDWVMGRTLEKTRAFMSKFMGSMKKNILSTDDKNKLNELNGSIEGAYEQIDNSLQRRSCWSAWRHKYLVLSGVQSVYEAEKDVVTYFKEKFSSWSLMEILLFMIREILCAEESRYDDLDIYVKNFVDQSMRGELPVILRDYRYLIYNRQRLKNERIREEIVNEFSLTLDEQGGLMGEAEIKKLLLTLEKAS